jgi:hypothetical protein
MLNVQEKYSSIVSIRMGTSANNLIKFALNEPLYSAVYRMFYGHWVYKFRILTREPIDQKRYTDISLLQEVIKQVLKPWGVPWADA